MKRSQLWLALPALLAVLLLAGCTHHQKVAPKNGRLPAIEKPKYSFHKGTAKGTRGYSAQPRAGRPDHPYPEEHRKSHGHLGMERVSLRQYKLPAQATIATPLRTQQCSSPSRPRIQTSSLWQRCVYTLNKTFRKPSQAHRHYTEKAVSQKRADVPTHTHRHYETFRKIPVRGSFNNSHERRFSRERQQPSVMQEKYTPRKSVPAEVIF